MEKSSSSPQYSWWWDSHHSPKHSQWLQSTLAELDRITKAMLTLIQEDGDSFAQRSEMYYKKKPELVKLIEEFHRSYRSLAERLDVLKFDSSVQTQSSSSSSSSKQSQNLQFPVKRSLQNSTSPELISNTTSPNSYPESVVEDRNLDGEYPKKLPEGLIATKAEISNMNFIDDHPKQKTGTKKLEINLDPNLNSINNYQKQKCGTRKVEIDLKAVKKSANGLSATETADPNLNITDHHKKYKCGTRTLEIDPKTAKKTERGNPNSNFFDDCQKKKSEIRKVKANQNAAENPAVNEPDIVNWKIDCSESGDSLIEAVEVQCFLERENMWAELQSQVSKLIEDNMKQQAELITRNEEKKEAIKALSSQLNKLVDENRALHKRCLSISNKENPFRISRLKEIFLWKFCGQGSRV